MMIFSAVCNDSTRFLSVWNYFPWPLRFRPTCLSDHTNVLFSRFALALALRGASRASRTRKNNKHKPPFLQATTNRVWVGRTQPVSAVVGLSFVGQPIYDFDENNSISRLSLRLLLRFPAVSLEAFGCTLARAQRFVISCVSCAC